MASFATMGSDTAQYSLNHPTIAYTLGGIQAGVVLLLSGPALWSLIHKTCFARKDVYKKIDDLYEDEDGKATEESMKAFSTFPARAISLLVASLGWVFAIASAVLQFQYGTKAFQVDGLLRLVTWLSVVFQAVGTWIERDPVARFNRGVLAMLSSLFILLELAAVSLICVRWRAPTDIDTKVFVALPAIQAGLALIGVFSFGLIPRRPRVYLSGAIVDAERSSSFWARATYNWCVTLLSYCAKNKSLTLDEVPRLSNYSRSENLSTAYFETKLPDRRLWVEILSGFRWGFVKQVVLISIVSFTQFIPQLVMFNLLNLLEKRDLGDRIDSSAWLWVVGLFFSMSASSLVECYLFWILVAEVSLPVKNLLSSIIFIKSTRRKDVKGIKNAKKQPDELVMNIEAGLKGEDTVVDKEKKDADEDEAEDAQKGRQQTVNLVGVDTQRVADFTSYVWIFPGTLVKLIVSFTFLYKLVGWLPLLAGIIAFFCTLPLNVWFSTKYNGLQGSLMKLRDVKMAVVTEALQGIRQIKFSALENQWQDRISQKRKEELTVLWSTMTWDTFLIGIWVVNPILLASAVLTTYALKHGSLDASIAFTAIAILGNIEMTLSVIPELTTDAVDAWVSITRIEKYLTLPEIEEVHVRSDKIMFDNASIAWPADAADDDAARFVLRDVNVEFPRGELSVISGKTGTGKSLMLAALLGEIDKLGGSIHMPKHTTERFDASANASNWILDDAVAYASQVPWIENATIRENILFGLPYDQQRYEKCVAACALKKDFELLESGDETDIGAQGINLSGGQKARTAFARSLYSRAGILVLDDILSAVDPHVGRQLVEEALCGELGKGRTRILVTHHVGLVLSKANYTVKLSDDGGIAFAGSIDDLRQSGDLAELEHDTIKEEAIKEAEELAKDAAEQQEDGNQLRLILSRRRSEATAIIDAGAVATKPKEPAKKFTEAEGRDTGRIKTHVYRTYFQTSGGFAVWLPLTVIFLLNMIIPLLRSYWVTIWTRSYKTEAGSHVFSQAHIYQGSQQIFLPNIANETSSAPFGTKSSGNPFSGDHSLWYFLGIYLGLSAFSVIIGTAKYFITYWASIKASHVMFQRMSFAVIRAPLRWLDTVPTGRILNRFSSDFNQLDSRVSGVLAFFLYRTLEMLGITLAAIFVSPYMIIVAVLLFGLVWLIASFYLTGAREIKRLESTSKSPIFEQFGSVLAGVGTVRAFAKVDDYNHRMFDKIDTYARAYFYNWLFNRWMGFLLNVVGALFAFLVASVIISIPDIDASLAGFALSFALQYTGAIISAIRGYAQLEMAFNATERIVEYTELKTEDQGGKPVPAGWPTEGRVEVRGLVSGYAEGLPAVLKGLTFTAEGHQRVGIVGRTGAGKSSLTLALFRFINNREGSVLIDGIDTSTISLHDLRSRLAIIPQDPVLFSGTIRSNLDPFDDHTDAELQDALERVHLVSGTVPPSRDPTLVGEGSGSASGSATPNQAGDKNTNIFNSLTSKISEGGLNLSQGQRQLLCLARAIVSHPKVMVLDEATSSVDMSTDVLIQRSIREEFADSTLLVIAHRLSTIADFDKILVMSEGKAVEFDSPAKLLEKKGLFYDMVQQSGEKEQLEKIIKAG